jgi:hypothetical protein
MDSMRESMEIYPRTAAERAMKLHEVLLRASAGKIKWWQAAELMGISARQMRRTLRGIRTFPPPLRLTNNQTGHFTCYQKRTFSLANDTEESALSM